MPNILRRLKINEVSSVDRAAGEGCRIVLYKRDNSADKPDFWDVPLPPQPRLFNDLMLRKLADEPRDDDDDDPQRTNTIDDDKKLSGKLRAMVSALITAAPSLREDQAMSFLLHSPHGRKLAEHLNNIISKTEKDPPMMPQVNIMKLIEVTEQGLMASVTRRDGESYHQSFARRYENDISFRKQWAALTDAKHLMALRKGMATLTPTSTEVGNTNVSDDSAEAVRLLSEMAARNGRSFEQVFADPANAKLARQTYTQHHRSSISYGSQER